ncbi:UPF0692 protein C19orf54 homolog isoform X1 [Bombina bombina]|uniref:UPF0692 protein C19orf54 homolog isoform X1 n=1 Tax=Bombina bombina TaxID=8345 RepID=UPI00235A914C|nr:UPF0692 protein C19orf54 homolog isoform X1 [Bombina bombina]XP_053577760.1 UPF0692 protein C19orf54 homolog isoform X1 [Bombina bombina]
MPEKNGDSISQNVTVPPPPMPPPPPCLSTLLPPQVKSKFFKKVAENSDPSVGGCEELKRMIKKQKDRFHEDLKWLLYNQSVPSLIQEGPQCGLVALWMAGALLSVGHDVSLETIVDVAVAHGFTAQGEMFSAVNMARLAEEVFGCCSEVLTGGMDTENKNRILQHLTAGKPILIPYDEDFNHEPCQREGYRAHWAVVTGVLFGTSDGTFQPDPEVPGLYHPLPESSIPKDPHMKEVYLVAKQGKSLRYQLWDYLSVSRSNHQLIQFDPKRASDGTSYVLPKGGVKSGLCGQTVLLHPRVA